MAERHPTYGRQSVSKTFPDGSGSFHVTREPDGAHVIKLRTPQGWVALYVEPDLSVGPVVTGETSKNLWDELKTLRAAG
jgi:hypothetical protein